MEIEMMMITDIFSFLAKSVMAMIGHHNVVEAKSNTNCEKKKFRRKIVITALQPSVPVLKIIENTIRYLLTQPPPI